MADGRKRKLWICRQGDKRKSPPYRKYVRTFCYGNLVAKTRFYLRSACQYFKRLGLLNDLSKSRCLAELISQIVEFCSSYAAVTNDFDAVNLGRMKGERSLYAYTERYSSYGESFSDATVLERDYNALERLNSLFVSFLDLNVDSYGVADRKFWEIGTHTFFFYDIYDIHLTCLHYYTKYS